MADRTTDFTGTIPPLYPFSTSRTITATSLGFLIVLNSNNFPFRFFNRTDSTAAPFLFPSTHVLRPLSHMFPLRFFNRNRLDCTADVLCTFLIYSLFISSTERTRLLHLFSFATTHICCPLVSCFPARYQTFPDPLLYTHCLIFILRIMLHMLFGSIRQDPVFANSSIRSFSPDARCCSVTRIFNRNVRTWMASPLLKTSPQSRAQQVSETFTQRNNARSVRTSPPFIFETRT